ncbi:MAG: signal recognition particle protein [Planctomycetaceae bacterium]|jgi:signal recognition particle subunit SRP54|nr:signal recognition particle protein [Planctomycetaceae bacterium]
MFESLQDGLYSAIRTLRGKGKLTDANMREGLRLVQQSLLEADVSYSVVRDFMTRISEQALGERVMKLLDPTEQVVKIVHDELINLMGPVDHSLHLKEKTLSILMLCGLQGSGKTTTCGKLGKLIVQRGLKPMFVAADLQRPAAIDQLEILGKTLEIPVHLERENKDPVSVCRNAVTQAEGAGVDVLILDTAGRLHIDEELMSQLSDIEKRVKPDQVYFVVDSMTGQDAINSAKAFNDALELDGVILTKLDGDARGGAAISVKAVTGVPIKFMGTGETLDALEEFHPDRMAGRILGMGDMLTLIEQAQQKLDQEELKRQQERLERGEFTLDDFRNQMSQAKRLGSMGKLLSFIPGMGQFGKMMGSMNVDADEEMKRVGGIIDSMTKAERRNPKILDQARRRRIAAGAGVEPHQVNDLIKAFLPMAEMMKNMASMGMGGRMRAAQEMIQNFQKNPMGGINAPKKGTGKRLSSKDKAKAKKQREKEKKKNRK